MEESERFGSWDALVATQLTSVFPIPYWSEVTTTLSASVGFQYLFIWYNFVNKIWVINTNKSLQGTKLKREGKRSSSFQLMSNGLVQSHSQNDLTMMKNNNASVISAFTWLCVFLDQGHTLDQCYQFGDKSYKDKLDFLRTNGFYFGCLVKGQISKYWNKRSTCQL